MQKITIVAKFPSTKNEYHYLAPDGDEPIVGDVIITSMSEATDDFAEENVDYLPPPIDVTPVAKSSPSLSMPHYGGLQRPWIGQASYDNIKFATIINILPAVSNKATKSYLMLMPRALITKRLLDNRNFAKRVGERRMAESRLKALVEERNNRDVYEKLAAENPEAARLIKLLDEPI